VLIDGTRVEAIAEAIASRFADALEPAIRISQGTYRLMWDLAKSDIGLL
jgi:hypothetical protein